MGSNTRKEPGMPDVLVAHSHLSSSLIPSPSDLSITIFELQLLILRDVIPSIVAGPYFIISAQGESS